MKAIKITKKLSSEFVRFPELKGEIGKNVEFIVLIDQSEEQNQRTDSKAACRTPGSARGLIEIADDFEKPLSDDMLEEFYK